MTAPNQSLSRNYVANVVGVHAPAPSGSNGIGVSAGACQVYAVGRSGPTHTEAVASEGHESTHVRGEIGACIGVLKWVPQNSTIHFRSRFEFVSNVINGTVEYKANADRWREFFGLIRQKHLHVTAEFVAKDERIFVHLRELARKKAGERWTELE